MSFMVGSLLKLLRMKYQENAETHESFDKMYDELSAKADLGLASIK
jgi:hypothetical protein